MTFLVTKTFIQQMCGETSYRRGEVYFRGGKVTIRSGRFDNVCEATVQGSNSSFDVKIKQDRNGDLMAKCSCPSLASFSKSCQHIAAVLIYLKDAEQSQPIDRERPANSISKGDIQLANEILGLFGKKAQRPSSNQLYFDKRERLDLEFTIEPVTQNEKYMFGVGVRIGQKRLFIIHKIRDFLEHIERRETYVVSKQFTYDPEIHCFQKEVDSVIQQFIQISNDEKAIHEKTEIKYDLSEGRLMIVPPSLWETVLSLLTLAPLGKIEHAGEMFDGIRLSNEPLPLQFDFDEATSKDYKLVVKGLNQLTVLEAYGYILFEGKLVKLDVEDCKRLVELKELLDVSGKHHLQLPPAQMEHFVENVIPGLRKLGYVRIAEGVSKRLVKTKLKAKLYLDRVNNRLLAGLEFHYGQIVIHPLEEERKKNGSGQIFIRDKNKEQEIMRIMDESGFAKTEGGYFLHNEELEYHFLYHIIPTMKKQMQIYASTAVKLRIHKSSTPPKVKVNVEERTDWLTFSFDIKGIPESEISNLLVSLEEKRKFYRLPNNSLLSLESAEFQEINHFLNDMGIRKDEIGKAIRRPLIRGFQLLDSIENGQAIGMGESFRKLLDTMRNPEELQFTVPDSLAGVLRDYQKQGFQWLKTLAHYQFGGILADDMGLGKTLQSIAFIVSVLPELRSRKMPVLVVAPSSLMYNWWNEIEKFAPGIKAVIVDGSRLDRSRLLRDISGVDVLITSYPLLRRDIKQYIEYTFHTLILDEAQAFKNPTTQTSKAVRMIQADYCFALTGTPVENSLEEIWAIFHVVFPNYLPDLEAFYKLSRETIAKRIRPFLLRRLKSDVLDELPEKIETIHSSELLPDQKKLYAAYLSKLKEDTLKHLDKDTFNKNRIRILAGLTRLRQLCCHPALFVEGYEGSSAKFEQLLKIIEDCRISGRRMLIFSQFTKMLAIIGRDLAEQGIPYLYLDGQTPASERVELCNRFNEGEQDVFLISLKAGGTGLNLTGADTVILYDLWWNPAVEQQAADRAHRMGQKNVVQVVKLVAHGTIEDKMYELQEKKKNLIEEILQPGQEKSSTLSEQDIRDILMI